MTSEIVKDQHLLVEATFEKLLGANLYLIIGQQILFLHPKYNTYVLTNISPETNYTANDYLQLPEGAPYQLLDSKLIFMAAPVFIHQQISGNIYSEIRTHVVSNKLGNIVFAPMDVHFDDKNVVQPDLIFVSIKRSNIIQKWIYGAPDFLVEILSKSTKEMDQTKKKKLYGQHDVLEYWIVNPEKQVIEVFHNQNKELQLVQTATKTDEIKSIAIDGFVLKVETVF